MVLGDLDPCASARGRVSRISCREIRQDRTVSQRGGPCSPEKRDVHRDMYECLDTDTALRYQFPQGRMATVIVSSAGSKCFRLLCVEQWRLTRHSSPPFSLRRPGHSLFGLDCERCTRCTRTPHLDISHTNCPNLDSLD
jgi:hypothetical protein